VNLERPLSLSTRLSGHMVQGHVDGTGELQLLGQIGDGNWWMSVMVPASIDRYLIEKGSITLDGISLTIADISMGSVHVAIIPHTYASTNLRTRKRGDWINIEVDLIAKYVEKLLRHEA
jgi:riboflavin synthase